ncbi:MAG: tetratricopeptide repeat protein [Alphaproteobacteria bacterium]|nr:tetratricopeptide repeat protein [Alphaproteobacteria bacterium]
MKNITLLFSALCILTLTFWAGDPAPVHASQVRPHHYVKPPVRRPSVRPAKPKIPKDTRTTQEKKEALECPFTTLGECTDHFLAIEDLEERNVALRNYASTLLKEEKKDEGISILRLAEKEAGSIDDYYTQGNTLRYIGEQYYRLELKDDAHRVFTRALELDWKISYIPRRLSGIIGIVEMQKNVEDFDGLRDTAMWSFRNGLLQQVAETGKPGEINRLITNLSRQLYPSNVLEILTILRGIDDPIFRKHVAYKLNKIPFSKHEDPAPVATAQVEALSPALWRQTDNFEQVMILCLMSRLDPAQGEARMKKAEELTKALPAESQDKAKEVVADARVRLKEALSLFMSKPED